MLFCSIAMFVNFHTISFRIPTAYKYSLIVGCATACVYAEIYFVMVYG